LTEILSWSSCFSLSATIEDIVEGVKQDQGFDTEANGG
jgi:hypothetical protein